MSIFSYKPGRSNFGTNNNLFSKTHSILPILQYWYFFSITSFCLFNFEFELITWQFFFLCDEGNKTWLLIYETMNNCLSPPKKKSLSIQKIEFVFITRCISLMLFLTQMKVCGNLCMTFGILFLLSQSSPQFFLYWFFSS